MVRPILFFSRKSRKEEKRNIPMVWSSLEAKYWRMGQDRDSTEKKDPDGHRRQTMWKEIVLIIIIIILCNYFFFPPPPCQLFIVAETELNYSFAVKEYCIKIVKVSPKYWTHFDYLTLSLCNAFVTESKCSNLVHSASILRTSDVVSIRSSISSISRFGRKFFQIHKSFEALLQ